MRSALEWYSSAGTSGIALVPMRCSSALSSAATACWKATVSAMAPGSSSMSFFWVADAQVQVVLGGYA